MKISDLDTNLLEGTILFFLFLGVFRIELSKYMLEDKPPQT